MNNEFKKITTKQETRYILETTSGATSSAVVATAEKPLGELQRRQSVSVPVTQKPRQGPLRPQTGGGAHRDKKKEQKQGKEKHRKPFAEEDVAETKKKPNATTRHLRQYPVSDKDVAKPVKKPEKKKPEQGVAEGIDAYEAGRMQAVARFKYQWPEIKELGFTPLELKTIKQIVALLDKGEVAKAAELQHNAGRAVSELVDEIVGGPLSNLQGVAEGFKDPKQEAKVRARLRQLQDTDPDNMYKIVADEFGMSEEELRDALHDEKGVAEGDNPEYNDEAGMVKNNIRTILRVMSHLAKAIKDDENIPEWCQEKIAEAKYMLVNVMDYMISQYEQGVQPNLSEKKIKGVDGKACWPGKRYAGRVKKADGTYKDKCIPVGEKKISNVSEVAPPQPFSSRGSTFSQKPLSTPGPSQAVAKQHRPDAGVAAAQADAQDFTQRAAAAKSQKLNPAEIILQQVKQNPSLLPMLAQNLGLPADSTEDQVRAQANLRYKNDPRYNPVPAQSQPTAQQQAVSPEQKAIDDVARGQGLPTGLTKEQLLAAFKKKLDAEMAQNMPKESQEKTVVRNPDGSPRVVDHRRQAGQQNTSTSSRNSPFVSYFKDKNKSNNLDEFSQEPSDGGSGEPRFIRQDNEPSKDGKYMVQVWDDTEGFSVAVAFVQRKGPQQYIMYPVDNPELEGEGGLLDRAQEYVDEIEQNAIEGSKEDFIANKYMPLEAVLSNSFNESSLNEYETHTYKDSQGNVWRVNDEGERELLRAAPGSSGGGGRYGSRYPRREYSRPSGMYFYNVKPGQENDAMKAGLKQTKSGKWYSKNSNQEADKMFGPGRYWEPKNEEASEDAYMENLTNSLTAALQEKAPPGAKYKRMAKHIKASYKGSGLDDEEIAQRAFGATWKAAKKAKK